MLPVAGRSVLLASVGALLVGLSAHLILVFPANVLGLVAGFACYFRGVGLSGTRRAGFVAGYLFGVLLAGSSLYWIADVLHVLTAGERVVGAGVVGGFLMLVALPYGVWGGIAGGRGGRGTAWVLFAQAPGLVLAQTLVQDMWLGFPWLHPGYWLAAGPFAGGLGGLGVRGAGLLVLHVAACLGLWGMNPRARRQALLAVGGLVAVSLLPEGFGAAEEGQAVSVAIVALEQEAPAGDSERDDLGLLSRYVLATRAAEADWVVWPESVIRDGEASLEPLGAMLGTSSQHVFAGALLPAPSGRYNALVELRSGRPVYYKRRRVPFSEYVPGRGFRWLFEKWGIHTLRTDVRAGDASQPAIDVGGVVVIPLICFEVAFTELIQPGERPAVLLHVGNEGWFRSEVLHRMTLAMSMARSREYGLPLVRAVTHGASGFFEPRGGGWAETDGGASSASQPGVLRPRRTMTPFGRLSMLLLLHTPSTTPRDGGSAATPGRTERTRENHLESTD
ncbi:MAG TPA: apolipoprotein N-acyltransferase [Myxococcaceae bacterium]|nr:apolipoprotein N-acyltransferase [Myxococcaceae bacterium]